MCKKDDSSCFLLHGLYRDIVEGGIVQFEEDYGGTFVKFYDVIQQGQDDLALYRHLIQSYGDPVLELGCGTGRLLIPLAHIFRTQGGGNWIFVSATP